MDEKELAVLIANQEHLVAKLNHEKLGSFEYRIALGILQDANQLLDEKRKKPKAS